jgi:NAD(P)-dependent dehydrogenase (short-subunit alcohol dehydrogenase family)
LDGVDRHNIRPGVTDRQPGWAQPDPFAPGITMNSVAPGLIPFEEVQEVDAPRIQTPARSTPADHSGTGEDIANAAVYFLKASNFVTGHTLQVDDGLGLR